MILTPNRRAVERDTLFPLAPAQEQLKLRWDETAGRVPNADGDAIDEAQAAPVAAVEQHAEHQGAVAKKPKRGKRRRWGNVSTATCSGINSGVHQWDEDNSCKHCNMPRPVGAYEMALHEMTRSGLSLKNQLSLVLDAMAMPDTKDSRGKSFREYIVGWKIKIERALELLTQQVLPDGGIPDQDSRVADAKLMAVCEALDGAVGPLKSPEWKQLGAELSFLYRIFRRKRCTIANAVRYAHKLYIELEARS